MNALKERTGKFKTRPKPAPGGRRVAVGLSGGVDSAVAAALLKNEGYEVMGVHLYCWDEGPYCKSQEDREMAVRVAKHLDIPIVIWDLRREYRDKVMGYFWEEYRAGRTPNPDIVCNKEIKFGLFMDRALEELGVDYIATGHYARIARDLTSGHVTSNKLGRMGTGKDQSSFSNEVRKTRVGPKLLMGIDKSKDQSYFLYTLTQKQLEYILFPIGNYRKEEVRKMAKELGLPNAERPDSQGICFVGQVPVSKFLREKLPVKIGPVVNARGEIIGSHDGVWFYTEGQRHGFKVFAKGGLGLPLYILGKDVPSNTLIAGRGKESEVFGFTVENPHWINPNYRMENSGWDLFVRLRHLGNLVPARVSFSNLDGSLLIRLLAPVRGVAPGQSAVFYRPSPDTSRYPALHKASTSAKATVDRSERQVWGDEVLGGGVIAKIKSEKLKMKNFENAKVGWLKRY